MTLSPINWVPVQDKRSKILCGKLWALKITQSDCLHQEYPTINLGSTSDWWQLQLHLWGSVRDGGEDVGQQEQPGGEAGTLAHLLSPSLPIHVSDTAATSQDGSIFRMQGSEGCARQPAKTIPNCTARPKGMLGIGLWLIHYSSRLQLIGLVAKNLGSHQKTVKFKKEKLFWKWQNKYISNSY